MLVAAEDCPRQSTSNRWSEPIIAFAIVGGLGYAIKTRGVRRLDAWIDDRQEAKKRTLAEPASHQSRHPPGKPSVTA